MQRFLAPLTPEQTQQQTLALSQEVEKEVQQRRAEQQLRDAQPRRGPGRPKRELDSISVLSSSGTSTSQEERERPPKRKYTHWLTIPLVFDILRAVKEHSGSTRRAVAYLQSSSKHNINGRFDPLDQGYIEEESEDEEKTEKQIMKERVYGERRSTRDRQPAKQFGFQLNSSQLKFSQNIRSDSTL